MRRFIHPRTARACAGLGAIGATTLAVCANPAPADVGPGSSSPTPGSAYTFANLFGSQLVPQDSNLERAAVHARYRQHVADRATLAIKNMVVAGDRIAHLPYAWGGGHGSFTSSGYDCSGSVSFVLHAAGLLSTPLDSTGLESFGDPGPGKHVTIYANGGHAWMSINGRRFDTNALQESGTRWSSTISSSSGYVVRHPRGL